MSPNHILSDIFVLDIRSLAVSGLVTECTGETVPDLYNWIVMEIPLVIRSMAHSTCRRPSDWYLCLRPA